MIDAFIRPLIDPPLTKIGHQLVKCNITANTVTAMGFGFGLLAVIAILFEAYMLAGFLFLANRLCDGLDGGVARASSLSDAGGYYDIISDFIIYPAIPLAFAFANPEFAAYSAFVIFAMAGAMTSFLAFAILCAKHNLETTKRGQKSFYYLGGICEGFETAVFLGGFCFFPSYFPHLATCFGILCLLTTVGRIFHTSQAFPQNTSSKK